MGFFSGKTALVTGAGSGIGRALARALADEGCKAVVVTDIIQERIDAVVEELKAKGVEVGGYLVDHSKRESVEAFSKSFFADWDHVDVLCSNAGVGHGARFIETTLEDWDWIMSINLYGAIYMMHYFVPKMMERNAGSILLTASDAGLVSIPGMYAYQTTKHAVMGIGTTLRTELWTSNIKVSMLCPAIVNTNILADGRVLMCDDAAAALKALVKDRPITIVPWSQTGPLYLLWRLSPKLYFGILRLGWKTGLLNKVFGV
jgi:NAD(P)-dependent dehydrogenase (short-subunit alcohol dehydrogenase family)